MMTMVHVTERYGAVRWRESSTGAADVSDGRSDQQMRGRNGISDRRRRQAWASDSNAHTRERETRSRRAVAREETTVIAAAVMTTVRATALAVARVEAMALAAARAAVVAT